MVSLIHPTTQDSLTAIAEKGLVDKNGDTIFPWVKGAYRLAAPSNYSDNFGKQWNEFKRTQLDKFSESKHSENRFFTETNWTKEDLVGKNILEVGSGAGRFSQIVLDHTEANLFSLDFSSAVEANFINNGPHPRLNLFQCSVYEMPFADGSFDKAFCLGVLQHTPDVQKTLEAIVSKLKPGGEFVVDFYPVNGWWTKLHAKYILRPITKKMPHDKLRKLIDSNLDWMISASKFFNKIGIGKITNRFIPVVDITTIPSDVPAEDFRQWVLLDTFDVYSPAYDQPQTMKNISRYLKDLGLENVWAGKVDTVDGIATVARGTKPK